MENLNLPLTIKVFKEGTSKEVPYVAYCPELDLSCAGKDGDRAKKALTGVIESLLTQKSKDGSLDVFLEDYGLSRLGLGDGGQTSELSFVQFPLRLAKN